MFLFTHDIKKIKGVADVNSHFNGTRQQSFNATRRWNLSGKWTPYQIYHLIHPAEAAHVAR